jgi:hypothetical protein
MTAFEESILKRIDQLHKEMDEKMNAMLEYLPSADIVTNERFCELMTENGHPLKIRGLREWFKKPGFPRQGSRRVPFSKAKRYMEENPIKK